MTCIDCSETCVLSKSRLMSKQAGTFRCPKCHTVHTKIYQAYGGGMSKKLLNIPEGQLSQFFKDARDMNFKQIGKNLSSLLDKHEVFEQSYSHGGAFKPLSVWEKEGFDAAAVETMSLPHDVKADRMFGLVYRVPLLTVVETGTRGTKSVTQADVKKKAAIDNEPCATHAESEAEAEGEGVAPDEQANDKAAAKRSRSRGSSNCSDKKKPRKDKKKKKKKKRDRSRDRDGENEEKDDDASKRQNDGKVSPFEPFLVNRTHKTSETCMHALSTRLAMANSVLPYLHLCHRRRATGRRTKGRVGHQRLLRVTVAGGAVRAAPPESQEQRRIACNWRVSKAYIRNYIGNSRMNMHTSSPYISSRLQTERVYYCLRVRTALGIQWIKRVGPPYSSTFSCSPTGERGAQCDPPPRGRRAGCPAGPGLPHGDSTGDDD